MLCAPKKLREVNLPQLLVKEKTSCRAYGVSCRARTGSSPSIAGLAPFRSGPPLSLLERLGVKLSIRFSIQLYVRPVVWVWEVVIIHTSRSIIAAARVLCQCIWKRNVSFFRSSPPEGSVLPAWAWSADPVVCRCASQAAATGSYTASEAPQAPCSAPGSASTSARTTS